MALKLRKDIKKSSYYVWFLGAKESKGLRGPEYILPVIKHLEQREKDIEPFKVTLQVSHKGLKIIQNIVSQNAKNSAKPKNETIKHFIPHNTITCVYQNDDVIACILLLFNPVTKCPLHIHAYRCDSLETATLLKQQLQMLIERPENQKKFAEIESRLKPPIKELKKVESSSLGSDTGTSTRESESSEERFAVESTRVSTLYDSVAAELRQKLNKNNVPILLPPRDYDTVHRQKGNLTGIELRRCLNTNIVGQNTVIVGGSKSGGGGGGRRIESSGGSSGIGSDHPPSPESPDQPADSRFNTLDNQSTSDEDWNGDTAETSTLYLMHEGPQSSSAAHHHHQMTLPRANNKSPERYSKYNNNKNNNNSTSESLSRKIIKEQKSSNNSNNDQRQGGSSKFFSDNKYLADRQKLFEHRSTNNDNATTTTNNNNNNRQQNKLFERNLNEDNTNQNHKYYHRDNNNIEQQQRYERKYIIKDESLGNNRKDRPIKYFDDDGFDENIRYRAAPTDYDRFNNQHRHHDPSPPVPKTRQKFSNNDTTTPTTTSPLPVSSSSSRYFDDDRYYNDEQEEDGGGDSRYYYEQQRSSNDKSYESRQRRQQSTRHPSPSPPSSLIDDEEQMMIRRHHHQQVSPRDRFQDAKEKFLSMEKDEQQMNKRINTNTNNSRSPPQQSLPSPTIKRHDSKSLKRYEQRSIEKNDRDRYYSSNNDDDDYNDDDVVNDTLLRSGHPKPAPRHLANDPTNDVLRYRPLERYRNTNNNDKYDPKRRSMFNLIEEEHRKNSNEIAKELKRRSYLDHNYNSSNEYNHQRGGAVNGMNNQEIIENRDRFHHHHRDNYNFSKSNYELDKIGGDIIHNNGSGGINITKNQNGGNNNNNNSGGGGAMMSKFAKNQKSINIKHSGGSNHINNNNNKMMMMTAPSSPGYRHSYAEPKLRMDKNSSNGGGSNSSSSNSNKKHYSDMLHRTNSVSNNGRVGIASVHPY